MFSELVIEDWGLIPRFVSFVSRKSKVPEAIIVLQRDLTLQPPSLNGRTKNVIIALDETRELLARNGGKPTCLHN